MCGYVIVNSVGKRAKHPNGDITPYFDYLSQALNYIENRCGNSPYLRPKQVGGDQRGPDKEALRDTEIDRGQIDSESGQAGYQEKDKTTSDSD